jgi:type VI secretion system protein ImpH
MAAARGSTSAPVEGRSVDERALAPRGLAERSLAERLLAEGYAFDFFQAVRLLEKVAPERRPVGDTGPPATEAARFRAQVSLSFPASAIHLIEPPGPHAPAPMVTVTFMGLTGPSGVLPRHYTEMLMRAIQARGPERFVARDWFDLFNHRLISLFYRAWTKYRFWLAYERGEYSQPNPDIFTESLYCLVGLGNRSLKKRLRVKVRPALEEPDRQRILARVDDLVLLYYAGLLSHRPRCALSLERLLADYFQVPLRVLEFQGQWLLLDRDNQTQLGKEEGNNDLSMNVVVGERVWDIRNKIRIRLGPLSLERFASFLPDQSPVPERKDFFKLMHLVRFYVGPALSVDVQLVLQASEIPQCRMLPSGNPGPRLGWNCWLTSGPALQDSEDAVFAGVEVTWVPDAEVRSARPSAARPADAPMP